MEMSDASKVPWEAPKRSEVLDLTHAGAKEYLAEQPASVRIIHICEDLEKGQATAAPAHEDFGSDKEGDVNAVPSSRSRLSATLHYSSKKISPLPRELPRLPPKREQRTWRILRHKVLSAYHRLFFIVFIANMIAFSALLMIQSQNTQTFAPKLSDLSTAAATNILAALLIRQEHVINTLYNICCMTPVWWPLRVRRSIAKIYHFGGIHSGCACSAILWFGLLTISLTMRHVNGDLNAPAVLAVTYILLTLLIFICISAVPAFRIYSHNTFEQVHRFAGWTSVGLFWVETLLVLRAQSSLPDADSYGILIVKSATFWILLIITFMVILPWVRLRKVDAFPENLSSHAVRIHFKYMQVSPSLGLRITDNPLKEWHAFAAIPEADGSSFSVIVSNAGDWTQRQIAHPERKYWVRGVPTTGIIRMAEIFNKVIIVTTGSGIGPCLSLMSSRPLNCRLLWSTPHPLQTYGESLIKEVFQADPEAMIIDTKISGRPNMVELTYHLVLEAKAEAVFVISNPSLTSKVVYGMETRGIAAFGPIWDS